MEVMLSAARRLLAMMFVLVLSACGGGGGGGEAAGSSRSLALAANAVAFDSTRNVYYASQSIAAPEGNRIAIVDAASGAVSYSAALGSDPGPLAVASDGSVLYVGLGSGDVVQLALPSMQELGRLRLPLDPIYGQLQAADISASPVAADVFAVSLLRRFTSPSHGGVLLVRGMVTQPRLTQDHTGSNRIGFGADGQWLYGLNNETSEWGMRRIEVVADGLIERKVVDTGSYHGGFDVRDGLVLVGDQVYRADDTLALLGTVADALSCVKLSGANKLGCQSRLSSVDLGIYDATSLVKLATPRLAQSVTNTARIVAGPRGAIAISDGATLTLFAEPSLQ